MKAIDSNLISSLAHGGRGFIKSQNYYGDFTIKAFISDSSGHISSINLYNVKIDPKSLAGIKAKTAKSFVLECSFNMPVAGKIARCYTMYQDELISENNDMADKHVYALNEKCQLKLEITDIEY
jgi:hypothetical protein